MQQEPLLASIVFGSIERTAHSKIVVGQIVVNRRRIPAL
jgi:hypothetical protein